MPVSLPLWGTSGLILITPSRLRPLGNAASRLGRCLHVTCLGAMMGTCMRTLGMASMLVTMMPSIMNANVPPDLLRLR